MGTRGNIRKSFGVGRGGKQDVEEESEGLAPAVTDTGVTGQSCLSNGKFLFQPPFSQSTLQSLSLKY